MHSYKKIHEFYSENSDSKVLLVEDLTEMELKSGSKQEYQRAFVKHCLSEYLGEEITVFHKESGAPFITQPRRLQISISHSKNLFSIQISKNQLVGVDVQGFKKDLMKSKEYFANEKELGDIELTELNLHLIWSAKEAIYKLLEGDIDQYKEGITVKKISDKEIWVEVNAKTYKCGYLATNEYVLVYS
ncbi:MAG: 4'-phosphopantetheinyl transferase superfamily protein [Fluviicola sp.]|nr:4'-phosphopantetheinyl transferase superfamily protein [Fluviicola sp.]